jgi:serine/threonine-protein kinase
MSTREDSAPLRTGGGDEDGLHFAQARVGSTLRGKWRLEGLLGAGGMAVVYAAIHCNNGRRAAVKMLRPELAASAQASRRFLREGYAANRVAHPGAVAVLDDDTTEDGIPFLVMELLAGETLASRWERCGRRLREGEVLAIIEQVLDVLAAAHEKGIVHRDIKPDNIFLCKDGGARVLDFGIARIAEPAGGANITRSNATLGTPAFMSPEQARGHWDEVDARSDLWSIGATLFTLLTGAHVHEGRTANEVLILAATQPARRVATLCPDLSKSAAAIIDRALQFDPAARWPTARAMQEAARQAAALLQSSGPEARDPGPMRVADPASVTLPEDAEPPAGQRKSSPSKTSTLETVEKAPGPHRSPRRILSTAAALVVFGLVLLTSIWWGRERKSGSAEVLSLENGSRAGAAPAVVPPLELPRPAPSPSIEKPTNPDITGPKAAPARDRRAAPLLVKPPKAPPEVSAAAPDKPAPEAPTPAPSASAAEPSDALLNRRK